MNPNGEASSDVWEDGLDPFIRDYFVREVLRQAQFGLDAWGALQASIKRSAIDHVEIWASVQALLVAAGIASRLLWPTAPKSQARGRALRQMLAVADDSPLVSRRIRDSFEHFDERLETWADEIRRGPQPTVMGDSNVGPLASIEGADPRHFLRHLDHTTWTLYFRGGRYELIPVARELVRLVGAASDALKR
jgi:hypothetical protein